MNCGKIDISGLKWKLEGSSWLRGATHRLTGGRGECRGGRPEFWRRPGRGNGGSDGGKEPYKS